MLSSKQIPAIFFKLHLAVVAGLFFFHALGMGAVFRAFLYINMLFVIYHYLAYKHTFSSSQQLRQATKLLFVAWFLLYVVNAMATASYTIPKELAHLFYALFIPLGLFMHVEDNDRALVKYGLILFSGLSLAYVLTQLGMIHFMHTQYGTLKNPHYLAQYSMLIFIGTLFSFDWLDPLPRKLLLIFILLATAWLLLFSHSRPAWLAMLGVVFFYLLAQRKQILSVVILAGLVTLTAIFDFSGAATHLKLLLANLQHEERVYIWHDVFVKIQNSNTLEWIFGRGVGQFSAQYSAFGATDLGQLVTFNSPHNFVLELLYTTGIAGLVIVLALYGLLISNLLSLAKRDEYLQRKVYGLGALLLANLFFTGITIPFFGNGHLLIALSVAGMTLYWLNSHYAK